ncbi:MAG: membrane dipeptidase [Chloroflexi bacterium]|nr:membrane dipeptidase [Chloroflexota bacterium]
MTVSTSPVRTHAQELHTRTLLIDGSQSAPITPEHIERLLIGEIDVVGATIVHAEASFEESIRAAGAALQTLARHADQLVHVTCVADIQRARAEKKIGIIFQFQHAPIEKGYGDLFIFRTLGVRVIQLTYNTRNALGDGCVEKPDGGLSRYGRQVVNGMNELGMLIDLSHCGDHTSYEAIVHSNQPVAITHANALAVCDSPRNKSDKTIRALAERGGVIGLNFWSPMTHNGLNRRPTADELFAHLKHLIDVAGIEHVGIGSDLGEGQSRVIWDAAFAEGGKFPEVTGHLRDWFNYETRMVEGLDTVRNFGRLTDEMVTRGYTDDQIEKLLGANFLRLYGDVLG